MRDAPVSPTTTAKREKQLLGIIANIEAENRRLKASAVIARRVKPAAVAANADEAARLWDAVHEARGEVARLRFAIGEVITYYRCARNAAANGHESLAAEYRLQLADWITQAAGLIDRPDTLYGKFKTVLTRRNASTSQIASTEDA